MKRTLLTYLLTLVAFVTYAQTGQVSGRIVDAESGEGLFGANAAIKGTSKGAMADFDGAFTISGVEPGAHVFIISYVGYEEFEKNITVKAGETVNLGDIKLSGGSVELQSVAVVADVAIDRETPVAVSNIKPTLIEEKLGTQEFPEILKSTPGVYATKAGGGYGDSRINLRGFSSENIAVMINGVPVNDMEWGGIYWSNWAGLSDVTRSMQVQRGLGASKVAVPSVGGSINIMTRTTDMKEGGSVFMGMGNNGYLKTSATFSTGLMDNGWAVTFSGSKTSGDGYIMGTQFEGYSYFFNVAKQINDNHELSLTGFGAPQWHNQRSGFDKQTIADWQTFRDGYRHNPTLGYDVNGSEFNVAKNYYHKPQFSLNHFWTINRKSYLSTALYASFGSGGGNSQRGPNRSSMYGSSTYRTITGALDYATIQRENAESLNGSQAIIASSNNNHVWYGVLSTYNNQLTESITLDGGVDIRYYEGYHNRTIKDLMGGEFFLDDSRENSAKLDPTQKLGIGDVVTRDYDGLVLWTGSFAQVEYSKNNLSAFLSGAVSNTQYQRRDNFYYAENEKYSEKMNFLGYSAKGGANYNLSDMHNVFVNGGYFSRAPYFSSVFLSDDVSNAVNPDAVNEEVISAELGYGFRASWLSANVNVYNTLWKNKTITGALDTQDPDAGFYNGVGVNALHRGVEFDFNAKPLEGLTITGMLSVGDWKWTDDITALANNLNGQPVDEDGNVLSAEELDQQYKIEIKAADVNVTDAAQTTAALGANYQVFKSLKLGVDYNYYARMFARMDVNDMNNENTWEVPAAGVLDANLKYSFKIGGVKATFTGKVNNVLDTEYITDADNGASNDWDTARVFYGFGRTWSAGLKLKF